MSRKIDIPVMDEQALIQRDFPTNGCTSEEAYVLMVLGDSMLPEFEEGEVILIDPNGTPCDGAYVVARDGDKEEYILRQLRILGGAWYLVPLNDLYPSQPTSVQGMKGVVVQKNRPGLGRKGRKFYEYG